MESLGRKWHVHKSLSKQNSQIHHYTIFGADKAGVWNKSGATFMSLVSWSSLSFYTT